MKFSELKNGSYFVIVDAAKETQVLVKDLKGNVRFSFSYDTTEAPLPETEVQAVYLKTPLHS